VTIVTTSNRAPADLYKNGLNREHFLPFIALIGERLDIVALNGPIDYRRDRLGQQDTWLVPNGADATAQLSAAFFRLTDYPPEDSEHVPSEELNVQGRTLHDRTSLSHRHRRRHSATRTRQPQRSRTFRQPDRRVVRAQGQAARRRRCPARSTISGR
jgi:predicted ATPase